MTKQSNETDLMFGGEPSSKSEILAQLSEIMGSRSGTLADRLVPNEPLIDWSDMLFCVTPNELRDAVNTIIDSGKFSVEIGNFSNFLAHSCSLGELKIETGTPTFAWNESAATEDLIVSFTLNRLYLNDYETLCKAHKNYPSLQILLNQDGSVVVRTYQTLKSGRTFANLMWTIIHFYHDVDRFYRDLAVFN